MLQLETDRGSKLTIPVNSSTKRGLIETTNTNLLPWPETWHPRSKTKELHSSILFEGKLKMVTIKP